MTAQWKRRAQRAEERQALAELEHYGIDPRIARYWAERTDTTPINPPRPERDPRGPAMTTAHGAPHWHCNHGACSGEGCSACQMEDAFRELAAYDPRGRVTVICGRCGQPALSEKTPTILAHYTQAHGKAPRQLVLGRFEERCEVTR